MKKINFTKAVASGNDFVLLYRLPFAVRRLPLLAQKICNRKEGAGADGLLVLEKSSKADIRMRVFNPDGSEADMCGNGARCAVFYLGKPGLKIETKAGIIAAKKDRDRVRIRLTDPKDLRLDMPLRINNRLLKVNFINTGVPHAVVFVAGLDRIDVVNLGRQIRYHRRFSPAGTNVDFVEVLNSNGIKIRTYERGVEAETLACGTGSAASALIFSLKSNSTSKINVHTQSKEVLKVYFEIKKQRLSNVWLEGRARIVYKGEWDV